MNFIKKYLIRRRKISPAGSGYAPLSNRIVRKYNLTRETNDTDILCYAPTKSMRFTYEGKVIVCCHNHRHVIGRYPAQNIHDIWFSNEADQLRELIRKNDLSSGCDSPGCESCAKMLTSGRYGHALARDFDYLPVNSNRYPSLMEFELDTACNLACIMCSPVFSSSIRKNLKIKKDSPPIYTAGFVDQLEEFIPHLYETRYYGGEPFLIPRHFEIWDRIIRINPDSRIFVQSNGSILNERIKRLMEEGRFLISLSIDSFTKKTYESIRVNSDFSKMKRNFSYFLDYSRRKNLQMTVVVCPMRQNWQEIPHIFRYCSDENIKLSFTTVLRPPECALWNLTSDELKEIHRVYDTFKYTTRTAQQNENLAHFNLLKEEITVWINEAKKREKKKTPGIDSAEIKHLKQELLCRIQDHIRQNGELSDLSYQRIGRIESKIEEVLNQVGSEHSVFTLLKQARLTSIEDILNTIETRDLNEILSTAMDESLSRENEYTSTL